MTLNKNTLAKHLAETMGFSQIEAKEIITLFFDEIMSAFEQGKNVKLSGFGNFILRQKKQRIGRNPKTGESAVISARQVVTFIPGRKLKELFEGSEANDDSSE
ncbi:MAG: integration host factor subunit alpha [Gammaproteobacteria bacterium]